MKISEVASYPVRLPPEAENQAEKLRWSLNTWLIVAAEEKLKRDQQKRAEQ